MLKRMVRLVTLALAPCSCALALQGCASRCGETCCEPVTPRDNAPRDVTVLGDDLSRVRHAFDSASDRWRVVALVSPTCSECVFGAEVVQKEIAARYPARDVAAIIVWIPMLPSDSEPAARAAATLFEPQRASQFYDTHRTVGWAYARQTFAGFVDRARKSLPAGHWLAPEFEDRRDGERPQWDLYMLYAPGVRWASGAPPMPTHWIRHLGRSENRQTSTYWLDSPESGPREGNLFDAMRQLADEAIGKRTASTSASTKIEVLGFGACPHTASTRTNVARAVAAIGLAADVMYVDQEKLPEGDSRRAWPAPTVLVDGRDLFGLPVPKGSTLGCRVYPSGAPTEAEIAAALKTIGRNSDFRHTLATDATVACTLTPDSLADRKRVLEELTRGVLERRDLRDGIAFRFAPDPGIVTRLSNLVELERQCCGFLSFRISVAPAGGPVWLELTGPPASKSVIEEYFGGK